jgi:hypothetical protein
MTESAASKLSPLGPAAILLLAGGVWAVDAPAKLAQALKAAIDQTNSRR